jgi:hypothetical protein
MLPWLGPSVAAAPFGQRALAYTTAWVAHSLLVQAAVWAVLAFYQSRGILRKNTREPALPAWKMLAADVAGYCSWMAGAGVVQAW